MLTCLTIVCVALRRAEMVEFIMSLTVDNGEKW